MYTVDRVDRTVADGRVETAVADTNASVDDEKPTDRSARSRPVDVVVSGLVDRGGRAVADPFRVTSLDRGGTILIRRRGHRVSGDNVVSSEVAVTRFDKRSA